MPISTTEDANGLLYAINDKSTLLMCTVYTIFTILTLFYCGVSGGWSKSTSSVRPGQL